MAKTIPDDLKQIMETLPEGWSVLELKTWAMTWTALIGCKKLRFRLTNDRGYIDVYRVEAGKDHNVPPPEEQRVSISVNQVVELVLSVTQPNNSFKPDPHQVR
jgi:hypothetical protein